MLFSILPTISLWGLNPRPWRQAFLTACADHGGQPPTDLTPVLPWTMDQARRNEWQQPLKPPGPAPAVAVNAPPDTS